jgi:hypothetical protein
LRLFSKCIIYAITDIAIVIKKSSRAIIKFAVKEGTFDTLVESHFFLYIPLHAAAFKHPISISPPAETNHRIHKSKSLPFSAACLPACLPAGNLPAA